MSPQYLTVTDIAELTTFKPDTVRRMAARGDLRALYVGGRYLFMEEDLAADIARLGSRARRQRRQRQMDDER